jgi:hypothetical protein
MKKRGNPKTSGAKKERPLLEKEANRKCKGLKEKDLRCK